MSVALLRQRRAAIYLSVIGMLLMVAAVSALSAGDSSGVALRAGMIMVTAGLALLVPWQGVAPAALACWLLPNLGRALTSDWSLFNGRMLLELPGLLGLAGFCVAIRYAVQLLEDDSRVVGAGGDDLYGIDELTGVYQERFLQPALESELTRSRRFSREFALVMVGIDELRQRFDYRDEEEWQAGFIATANLLRGTRNNIDCVYRYGTSGFALILPESTGHEVTGLVRRLRRLARTSHPREGDPGGPLPASFGATFFPTCGTTVEDLLRRAEVALRIAERSSNHLQLDSAEAPAGPAPETLRRGQEQAGSAKIADGAASALALSPGSNGHQEEIDINDFDQLLKHFDETRVLLHNLRTAGPSEKAS